MENLYELMVLTEAELADRDEKKIFSKIEEFLESKGKILKTSELGKRMLAYPIKKKKEGKYFVLDLALESLEVKSFSQKLALENNLLRFFILKKDDVKTEVKKEEKEDSEIKKIKKKGVKKDVSKKSK